MSKNLQIGDYVKVKDGLKEPDYDSVFMNDWQGKLIDIEGSLLTIELDSKTILSLPVSYLIRVYKDGCDIKEICLETSDVEIVSKRRCTIIDDNLAKSKLYWISLYEDESIKYLDYFKDVDIDDESKINSKWIDYLTENLELPLNVEVVEKMRGGLKIGEKIKLLDFDGFDEKYGILGVGKSQKDVVTWPICDLEVIDKNAKSYQPLKDYCIWFANR